MKKLAIIFLVTFFSFAGNCHGEQITLTTYYPSPVGSYGQLRLSPRSQMSEECQIGTFYTLKGTGRMFYCKRKNDKEEKGEWSQVILIDSVRKIEVILEKINIKLYDTTEQLMVYMEDTNEVIEGLIDDFDDLKEGYDEEIEGLHDRIDKLKKQKDNDIKVLREQIDLLRRSRAR